MNQSIKNNPISTSNAQDYSVANQAIDGLPNELLRYNDPAVFGVMGVNTANAVNSTTTNSILPGLKLKEVNPNWPPAFVTETNVTVEQALKGNSVLQISGVWAHTTNLDLFHDFNFHPSTYQWEMATGTVPPKGAASVIGTPQQNTYAATATGPYNQTWLGSAAVMIGNSGWTNDTALEVNYQRLFHHGSAYQISYVYSNAMTTTFQATDYPDANYPGVLGTLGTTTSPYGTIGFTPVPPPSRPANLPDWADWHAMIKYQTYQRNSAVPKVDVKFNGLVDLPFGRGKRFLGNSNRFLNELVGGFQLAGNGQVITQIFQTAGSGNWGPTSPVHVYKHKVPVTDCTSGVCYKAYLWYNGYIPPSQYINCTTNCVTGLPGSYVPAYTPIDNTPGTTYYESNEVQITAPNVSSGKPTPIAFDGGPAGASYLAKNWYNGPVNWTANASLFKVFPITEKVNLRFNVDAFNVFNVQGYVNPAGSGLEDVQPGAGDAVSYWAPRQIQLTLRLSF